VSTCSAAPEVATRDAAISTGNGHSLSHCGFPGAIVERLAANNITTAADWLKLSRKQRSSIWGVTRAMVVAIDAAVAAMRARS
jgi:hypothetical protein